MRLHFGSFNFQPQPVRFGEGSIVVRNGKLYVGGKYVGKVGGHSQGSCGDGGLDPGEPDLIQVKEKLKVMNERNPKPKQTDTTNTDTTNK